MSLGCTLQYSAGDPLRYGHFVLLAGGRLRLRTRLLAQAEMHVVSLGDVRPLLRRVALTMLFFEGVIAVILTIRFRILYFDDLPTAAWHGLFHSVMAFNNAGFALQSDSLVQYAGDAWLIFPICVAVFAGAIGSMDWWGKFVTGVEGGIMPRPGGFNSFDYSQVRPETLGPSTILMFIGGVGTITAASALAMRRRTPRYHLPEGRPIIG